MTHQDLALENNTAIADGRRIDVSVDGDTATIRMLSYADGIGWFTQKTITVDADMLDALQSQIAMACGKIRRDSDTILSADILEF